MKTTLTENKFIEETPIEAQKLFIETAGTDMSFDELKHFRREERIYGYCVCFQNARSEKNCGKTLFSK